MGSPSGTTSWNPPLSDLGLDAFSRCQIRPGMLTANHMRDLLSSANLLLVEWNTKPDWPNLWKMQLNSVQLYQGMPSYQVPRNVVGILDYYVRQYQMGGPADVTPTFTTQQGETSVTVYDPQSGAIPGGFAAIGVPVAIGGIVLQNFYEIISVIDPDHFTIEASSPAAADATGGAVPVFTTTAGSSAVRVNLTNHGLYPQQNFTVQVPTQVDGVPLSGIYPVATVIDANNFTITASVAGSPATAAENGGQTQISISVPQVPPASQGYTDFVITPISRTEYADQPNKLNQARPTTVWWNRQIDSVLTMWPVPDQNGPYVLYYWALTQIQDAVLAGGVTMDIPYRFLEAYTAGLAAKLAEKYPPPPPNSIERLEARADKTWAAASSQDSEDVPLYITPVLSSYYT